MKGDFLYPDIVPASTSLESLLPDCITDSQVEGFLDLMRKMLCWLPEDRATAEELAGHPWLKLKDSDLIAPT